MTTELQKKSATQTQAKPSVINLMASRYSVEPSKLFETLKSTVFRNANDAELMALIIVANEYGLNPFTKEIYAFPAKGGGITAVVGIDGWIRMTINHPQFDGLEFQFEDNEDGTPYSCTSIIHVKNRSHPSRITEYFDECFRDTDNWKRMPRRMLRHRAICQGARVAFGFSGIVDDDEAESILVQSTVTSSEPVREMVLDRGTPEKEKEPVKDSTHARSPQSALESLVIESGFTFGDFQKWGITSSNLPDGDSLAGFDEVPSDVATRLLKAKVGLINSLKVQKGSK